MKLLYSTIAGATSNFILGFLLYAVLFADFFTPAECVTKIPMEMWATVVSSLTWALLLSLIIFHIPKYQSFREGLMVGAIVGLLVTATVDFSMYSMSTMLNYSSLLLDLLLSFVANGITGAIIGLILGSRGSKRLQLA